MSSSLIRRLGLVALVLISQALTACVVVPVPPRPRAVVVDVHPGYGMPPHHRHHHHGFGRHD